MIDIKYNEEQKHFIKSNIEDSCLLGIPGGGKTASIIGKIIYHFEINEIEKNNDFLILSFSRRACMDFIEKGQKQNKKLFSIRNIKPSYSISLIAPVLMGQWPSIQVITMMTPPESMSLTIFL